MTQSEGQLLGRDVYVRLYDSASTDDIGRHIAEVSVEVTGDETFSDVPFQIPFAVLLCEYPDFSTTSSVRAYADCIAGAFAATDSLYAESQERTILIE